MPVAQSSRPVALVTGASAGLGRVFAQHLAKGGHDLVLVARDRERLSSLALQLSADHGTTCEVMAVDLSLPAEVDRVVARIDAAPIDVLVNNAGFGTRGTLSRTSRAAQEAMLQVHVIASHRLAQAAVTGMVARDQGTIINVASIASFVSSAGNVNYCATKTYLRVYAEALAKEVEGTGVYVQALCPGFTHTEFHARGGMDKSKISSWLWLSAERVIDDSLRAMRRRGPVVVIPGLRYRLIAFALRHAPLGLLRGASRRYSRR